MTGWRNLLGVVVILIVASGLSQSARAQTLLSDDFDNGTGCRGLAPWTTNNAGAAGTSTAISNSGNCSMFVSESADVAATSEAINATGLDNLRVRAWVREGSNTFSNAPESPDDMVLEYMNASSAWTQVRRFDGAGSDQTINVDSVLPGDAAHSGLRVRFRMLNGSGNNFDFWHIDDVEISSTPSVGPAPSTMQTCTALTGAWSGGATTSGGIDVTRVLANGPGASWDPSGADAMNTIDGWSTQTVQGQDAIVETFRWNESGDTGTYGLNFGKAVTNPVIHIDRVGGFSGVSSNSSIWTLTSPGTLFRLAGPDHFETFADGRFRRTIGQSAANTAQSSLSGASGTAPGSIMIEGTMSSVSFDVTGEQVGGGAAGDAVEIVVCVPQNDLSLSQVVDNATPSVGQDVTYTLTLSNAGPQVSDATEVTDSLPAGLSFVSATPSQGSYDEASGIWNVGTLGASQTASLDITATVTGAGPITNEAEVTAAGYVDIDSDPGDAAGDDFASVDISPTAPTPVTCPAGRVSDGRATSGTGAFRDEIYWLDWSCGATTRFDPGDAVTKTWDAGDGVTITAEISNITAPIRPYDTGDWGGDRLDDLYGGINPIGLADAVAGQDPSFDIRFSVSLGGQPIDADLIVADAEDAATSNESLTFSTDGTSFQPIEADGRLDAAFSNAGQTVQLDDVSNSSGGTMLALSEGVTRLSTDIRAGGVSAAAFGLFLPFDHGDASGYGARQSHYIPVSATGGSQPTTPTDVTTLTTATIGSGGSLHLGAAAPDADAGNQSSADASADDADGSDDEDGVTFPVLAQGQGAMLGVEVSQPAANRGYLQGWIDWNGDGVFSDTGEQVASDVQSASAGTGTINVPVSVPASATTNATFARFRWSTRAGLDAAGAAPDGEVEDYQVTVKVAPLLDLNSAATLADTDRDVALAYGAGEAAQTVMENADVNPRGENDVVELVIEIQDILDGNAESVTLGGEPFALATSRTANLTLSGQDFTIGFDTATQQITVTSASATAEMDQAALDALLQSYMYEHSDQDPTTGARLHQIRATDADGLTTPLASATISVEAASVDLALSFDALSGAPLIGFPETIALNLQNESANPASGVSVSMPLPPGWAHVSDDTGGQYDPATGLWTPGSVSANVIETVEFTLVPLASGPHDLVAQIATATETDTDSTPANDQAGEDDQTSLSPAPQMGTGTPIADQSCGAPNRLALDWDVEAWPPGTRNAGFSYSGISLDVDVADPQAALDGTPNGPMPVGVAFYQGGLASTEASLTFEADDAGLANGDVTTSLVFGRAVDDVRLSLFDIDGSPLGPRLERVSVRGFNGAASVQPILEAGAAISVSGPVAIGVEEADPTGAASGAGTVTVGFSSPVDRVEIDYGHAPGTDRDSNPGNPGFALHDVGFCGRTAQLDASKSVSLYTGSPTNPGLYATPGEDVIYAITVENTGTGPADTDTIELIDAMPREVSFHTGATSEFGNAVIGWDETGTGLSFSAGTDVAYSDSLTGPPADFAACSYTPLGTYDPNVTYICFNPKGAMAAGSQFELRFRAKIR